MLLTSVGYPYSNKMSSKSQRVVTYSVREVVVEGKLGETRGKEKKMKNRKKWSDLFAEKSEAVSRWRKEKPKATLTAIEKEVDKQLAEVRAKMVEDLTLESKLKDISKLAQEERPKCPVCEQPLAANGKQTRRLLTKDEQEISLIRSKGYCQSCQVSFFPPR